MEGAINQKINHSTKDLHVQILELEKVITGLILTPSIAKIILAHPEYFIYLEIFLCSPVLKEVHDFRPIGIDYFTLEELQIDLSYLKYFIDNKLDYSNKTDNPSIQFSLLCYSIEKLIDLKIRLLVKGEANAILKSITWIRHKLLSL